MSRELDAEVAKKVMESLVHHTSSGEGMAAVSTGSFYSESTCRYCGTRKDDSVFSWWLEPCESSALPYSTNTAAAFQVVERMMALGYRYVLRGHFERNGLHSAAFDRAEWADANPLYHSPLCATLPEAICLAALAAHDKDKRKMSTVTENGITTDLKEKPRLCATIELLRHPDISAEDFEAQLRERVSPLGEVKVLLVEAVTVLIK